MALPPLESEYQSWSAGPALRIEYPAAALEDMCADAVEALGRVRHGGVEIGGVLFGVHRNGTVRISDYRPLTCEYAYGPRFTLSEKDRTAMRDLLSAPGRSPQLRGLQAVGWYHSHTRTDIVLSPRDLEIYDQFFPEAWQIAIVIRPELHELSIAGFFIRDGVERPLFETEVRAHRHNARSPEPPPPPRAPEPARTPGPVLVERGSAPAESARPKAAATAADTLPPLPSWARVEPKRRRWPWAKHKKEEAVEAPPPLPKAPLETLLATPPPEPPPEPAPAAVLAEEVGPVAETPVSPLIEAPVISLVKPPEPAYEAAAERAPEPVAQAAPEAASAAPEPERSRWSWAKSKARLRKAEPGVAPAAPPLPEQVTETGPYARTGGAAKVPEAPPGPEPSPATAKLNLRMPAPPPPAPVTVSPAPFSPEPERLVLRDVPAPLPSFAQAAAPRGRRWLGITVLLLLGAAAGVGGGWYWRTGVRHAPLALWVADVGGQLMIEWDRTARPIRRAERGTLEISDGGERVVIQMDADKLKEGSVDYVRRSEIVDVKLRIALPDGGSADELIRFVGPPVARTATAEVTRERDALKAEVERLTAELEKAQRAPRARRRE